MTASDCENRKKQGDCITRNARTLCDFCDSLLSDDERTHREIALFVEDLKRKAAKSNSKTCLTLRKTDRRNCREKKLTNPCAYCCAQMTQRQIVAHATKIVNERNENRAYWRDQEESQEYLEEMKEAGVVGIDWNIECDFGDESRDYTSRTAIIFFLFAYGKPCFIHSHEGWIKHDTIKKAHLNQSSASHR